MTTLDGSSSKINPTCREEASLVDGLLYVSSSFDCPLTDRSVLYRRRKFSAFSVPFTTRELPPLNAPMES
ncbi:hypothetical protein D3C75_1344240 [compost metagenome]